jgi:hypothetical protein
MTAPLLVIGTLCLAALIFGLVSDLRKRSKEEVEAPTSWSPAQPWTAPAFPAPEPGGYGQAVPPVPVNLPPPTGQPLAPP